MAYDSPQELRRWAEALAAEREKLAELQDRSAAMRKHERQMRKTLEEALAAERERAETAEALVDEYDRGRTGHCASLPGACNECFTGCPAVKSALEKLRKRAEKWKRIAQEDQRLHMAAENDMVRASRERDAAIERAERAEDKYTSALMSLGSACDALGFTPTSDELLNIDTSIKALRSRAEAAEAEVERLRVLVGCQEQCPDDEEHRRLPGDSCPSSVFAEWYLRERTRALKGKDTP